MNGQEKKNNKQEIHLLEGGAIAERMKKEILNFSKEKGIFIYGNTLKAKEKFINQMIDFSIQKKYDSLYTEDDKDWGITTFVKHDDSIEIFFAFHTSRDIFVAKELFMRALEIMKNKYHCNKFWFEFCPRKNYEKYTKFIVSYMGFSRNEKNKRFELNI